MKKVDELPSELLALHRQRETPSENWLTGAEHELLCVTESGAAPSFEGDRGIEQVLRGICEEVTGLHPVLETGKIIGLKGRGGSVTLEPGGQVELSGAAHPDVHRLAAETSCYQTALETVAESLKLEFFAMGVRPVLPVSRIRACQKLATESWKRSCQRSAHAAWK